MPDWRNIGDPWNAAGMPARPAPVGSVVNLNKTGEEAIYKAVLPQFLYKPPYS